MKSFTTCEKRSVDSKNCVHTINGMPDGEEPRFCSFHENEYDAEIVQLNEVKE